MNQPPQPPHPALDADAWPADSRAFVTVDATSGGSDLRGLPVAQQQVVLLARELDRVAAALADAVVVAESAPMVGLPTRVLLAAECQITRTERADLARVSRARRKMPTLDAAARSGELSTSQVREISRGCHRIADVKADTLDAMLAHDLEGLRAAELAVEADWIVERTLENARSLDSVLEGAEDRAERAVSLKATPDLFGGGTIDARYGAVGFQTVMSALEQQMQAGGLTLEASIDDDARGRNAATLQAAQAAALVGIAKDSLAGRDGEVTKVAVPTLTLTATLDSLAGITDEPGRLLTKLFGGSAPVSGNKVREIADGGAHVRLVVHDDTGIVSQVGASVYRPPGWLRDTIHALFPRCIVAGCDLAAMLCDLDHHTPHHLGGATSIENLGPLCRTHHREKGAGVWSVTEADGARVVTHLATGRLHRQPSLLEPRGPTRKRRFVDRPDPGWPDPAVPELVMTSSPVALYRAA